MSAKQKISDVHAHLPRTKGLTEIPSLYMGLSEDRMCSETHSEDALWLRAPEKLMILYGEHLESLPGSHTLADRFWCSAAVPVRVKRFDGNNGVIFGGV